MARLNWYNLHKTSYNIKHISTVSLWGLELVCWGKAGMSSRPWVSWCFSPTVHSTSLHTWTSALVFLFDILVSNGTVAQAWPPAHLAGVLSIFAQNQVCMVKVLMFQVLLHFTFTCWFAPACPWAGLYHDKYNYIKKVFSDLK